VLVESAKPPERLHRWQLFRDRYVVLCPEDHPLTELEEIPTAALATESLLAREPASDFEQALERLFTTAGIAPKPRHRCSGEDQVRQMVAAGLGIALSAEHGTTGAGIVVRPLADPAARRNIVLAAVAGRQHSLALAAFLKLMRARDWRDQKTVKVSKP
jgi:DNA-binding transcriptional LysR family regulator